jgi:hypothetical protein
MGKNNRNKSRLSQEISVEQSAGTGESTTTVTNNPGTAMQLPINVTTYHPAHAQILHHLEHTGGQAYTSSFLGLLLDRDNLFSRVNQLTQELGKEQAAHKETLVKLTDFAATISVLQTQGKTQLEINRVLQKEVDDLRAEVEALKTEVDNNKHLAYFCEWVTRFCDLVTTRARDEFKLDNVGEKVPFKTWGDFRALAKSNPSIASYYNKVPAFLGISPDDWKLIVEFKGLRNNTFHPEIDIDVLPTVNLDGNLSVYKGPLEKAMQVVFDDYKHRSTRTYNAIF